MAVNKKKKHNVAIVIDRLKAIKTKEDRARLSEAVEGAINLSNGLVTILINNKEQKEATYSKLFACPDCGISLPELEPRNFSFNLDILPPLILLYLIYLLLPDAIVFTV